MGMDFLERLQNNCLTSIEDYRRMQVDLYAMKKEAELTDQSGTSDEWKKWELAPVGSPIKPGPKQTGVKSASSAEPSSAAAHGVHKALKVIDKYQ